MLTVKIIVYSALSIDILLGYKRIYYTYLKHTVDEQIKEYFVFESFCCT
jgi:hypothetical protein